MPWIKQFDEVDVLDKAMHAFWARGYEATSVQDLVDCMGINRGSIYASFGDKRTLFLKALDRYETAYRRVWLTEAQRDHGPRGAILAIFENGVETALVDNARVGCFLVNSAIELSSHDGEIAKVVADGLTETEAFFRAMVTAGQQSGEISATIDADEAARALLGLLMGLRVLARSRPERRLLESITAQAAALLDD